MKHARWWRMGILLTTGSVVFQIAGCSTTVAPLILSLGEQILLSVLFGGAGATL